MSSERLPFIDWMKALGMLLIVYGHVAAATVVDLTPPLANPKQLGVAFFLFALGFSLARETRPAGRVVYNRLFEVYLLGLGCAVLMTGLGFVFGGRLALSNYLPFIFGINVVRDSFPANPTTWYIGTYIHFLLLWAFVLRGRRVGVPLLLVAGVVEVAARALLMGWAGLFVAYMLLTNWLTCFLLGAWYGQLPDSGRAPAGGLAFYLPALAASGVAWPLVVNGLPMSEGFPFRRFESGAAWLDLAVTSAGVTVAYLVFTWLVYQVTRRLGLPWVVDFLARNTLLVFIMHMPVYYALTGILVAYFPGSYALRAAILFAVCYPCLAVVSEGVRRFLRPRRLAGWLWPAANPAPPPPADSGVGERGASGAPFPTR